MAIFRLKNGDVMGAEVGRRPSRMQMREIAKKKQSEEEAAVLKDETKVQKASRMFREAVARQRMSLGLA
jgi:hypothetical protein